MTVRRDEDEPTTRPAVLLLGAEWFDDRPGGLNRYLRDLLDALDRTNPVRAVLIGPARSAPGNVQPASHAGAPLPLRLVAFTRAAARAARDVDVVDVHFALYGLLPLVLTRLRRLPVVVHFQGPWAEESRVSASGGVGRVAVKRALELAVYRRGDEFVVLSEAFRRILVERYGVAPWLVNVVPPAVDLERFAPGDQGAARRELGLPNGAFVAVVARRLEPRMGLEVLLEAWPAVVGARPDAVLVVIGAGQLEHSLRERASTSGQEGSVRFLGRVSDEHLAAAYRAADVSVVPTLALEGFGLVVLESLASGTPAVITDAGGLPETVVGLDGAAVIPAGNADALATALVAAAGGAAPSRQACRQHAERYSAPLLAERHNRIYERARGRGRRPRVLFVDHCAQLSGGELALARLLTALDVDAHVVLGEEGPLVELLRGQSTSCEVLPLGRAVLAVRKDDVRPGRVPFSGMVAAARSVLSLRRRIRQLRPDIVHTNSLKAALYGGVAARLAGVPVVWHVRDRVADDYLPTAAVRLVRLASRVLPNGLIANSRTTLATLGPVSRPSAVIPSPVSIPEVTVPVRANSSRGPLVVGMVGRLAPWKGQDVFLRAFAEAFPHGSATAVVVGGALFGEEEAYERELHALASSAPLEGRVRFTGHVQDVASELQRFDLLVHASVVPEPFGQVVVEGMAAGIPVIASDAGGPAEVISHDVDGVLFPPGDAAGLASVLAALAADPERRARLAEAGRRRAQAFAPQEVAAAVIALYGDLTA